MNTTTTITNPNTYKLAEKIGDDFTGVVLTDEESLFGTGKQINKFIRDNNLIRFSDDLGVSFDHSKGIVFSYIDFTKSYVFTGENADQGEWFKEFYGVPASAEMVEYSIFVDEVNGKLEPGVLSRTPITKETRELAWLDFSTLPMSRHMVVLRRDDGSIVKGLFRKYVSNTKLWFLNEAGGYMNEFKPNTDKWMDLGLYEYLYED